MRVKHAAQTNWMEARLQQALARRRATGRLRRLLYAEERLRPNAIDFSSNDYLGLAADVAQMAMCEVALGQKAKEHNGLAVLGATGSRLLSGDSPTFQDLERFLANAHGRPAALLCNSGYDANLAVVSSLPCQTIVYDEYIHNSLHMGLRLWKSVDGESKHAISFLHNNVDDLGRQLENFTRSGYNGVVVLIESVYSMDGDLAPVKEMLDVCETYKAQVVVDEAHGLGVYGRCRRQDALPGTGVVAQHECEDHPALFCSVHTFGKAAGCHGAVVCGSKALKEHLINYAYPIIYSTALPLHSLVTIRCSYETMTGGKGDQLRDAVFRRVQEFRQRLEPFLSESTVYLLPSSSPIQALMISGNNECTKFCDMLFAKSQQRIRLFPIKSPTVPTGHERIRIILHSNNTEIQVEILVRCIQATLMEMQLIPMRSRL